MSTQLILVAASGLARDTAAAAAAADWDVIGYLDDDQTARRSLPVLGPVSSASEFDDCQFVVCAGSGMVRRSIVDRMGVGRDRFATVVHPSVDVPTGCFLGPGCVVLAQVVLTADVTVGSHTVLMPHVVLTHDDAVGDYVTLCAGTSLGGGVVVEDEAYLGMNASVRQNVRVGARSTIGMGSVVLLNVPAGETWVGSPAGSVRRRRRGAA